MPALRMFIPITKVDAARRLVYGVATAEKEDRSGEICDYASTKPLYEKWSADILKSTKGKSRGNLRAMHGPVAAGKVTEINFNDEAKQIEICAKVVDDSEWQKVVEAVYTGFSQGGSYEKRWTDAEGFTRYTAAPTEISLVDLPCLPEATFEMIKADGTREQRPFRKRMDTVARLANIIEELDWLKGTSELEEMMEQDDSAVPDKVRDLVSRATALLRVIIQEETPEIEAPAIPPTEAPPSKSIPKVASTKAKNLFKAGARNSAEGQARIQHMHDTSVELGAICGFEKFASSAMEKRFDIFAETLADVLRRVKNIEDQPLPLPLSGSSRLISKAEDGGSNTRSEAEKLLLDPDALSILAIKLAQRNGRPPLR